MCDINKCGICLETLEKTNVCVTKCSHSFCLKCIIKSTKYNNGCPYCRKEIIEKEEQETEEQETEEQETEEQETEEQETEAQYTYIGRIDYDEECYHFPVVIEDIQTIAKVINEVTGGTFCSDNSLGWILGILSIINDNEETQFNFMDDKSFENEMLVAEHSKIIIMETVYIYKRSIILKKHLENKYK